MRVLGAREGEQAVDLLAVAPAVVAGTRAAPASSCRRRTGRTSRSPCRSRSPTLQQQRVERDHHQDRVFSLKFCTAIERPGAHQDVAAVLQQRVHRHDEEAGAARRSRSSAAIASQTLVTKIIAMTIEAHRDAERDARCTARSQRHAASRRAPRRARCRPRTTPCRIDGLRQVEAERGARPVEHDELQRRAGAPEQRGRRRARSGRACRATAARRSARSRGSAYERVLLGSCVIARRCRGMNEVEDRGDRRRRPR